MSTRKIIVASDYAAGDLSGPFHEATIYDIPVDAYGNEIVISGGTAAGDLSGTYPNPTVAKLQGRAVQTAVPTDAYGLTWSTGSSEWQSLPVVPYYAVDAVQYSYDLASAVAAIGANNRTLIVSRSCTVSDDLVVPLNIDLVVPQRSTITVASGKSLTINGRLTAGRHQIFSGAGTILGLSKVDEAYPEWWGAVADGATDCVNAMNAFFATTCRKFVLGSGDYYCSARVCLDSSIHPRRPIEICSIDGRIIRHVADAIASEYFDVCLYINNINEYQKTVTTPIAEGAVNVTLDSTSGMAIGDVLYIYTYEIYGWRGNIGGEYYSKMWCSRVLSIDSPTQVTLVDESPHHFKLHMSIVVLGWTTYNPVFVRNLRVAWDVVDETTYSSGLLSRFNHFGVLDEVQARKCQITGVRTENSYSETVNRCDIMAEELTAVGGLNYGLTVYGCTLLLVFNTIIESARHAVAFSGFPSVKCRIVDSRLITRGLVSGYSFDAHIAESVSVENCYLNNGAKFAGGTFSFMNCDIYTDGDAVGSGLFARRGVHLLKGVVVKNCNLHINRPILGYASGGSLLFGLSAAITDGYINFGDMIIEDNELYADSAISRVFPGDGVTTDFICDDGYMPYQQSNRIEVYLRNATTHVDTLQTITTHYSVLPSTDGYASGGTFRFVTPPSTSQYVVVVAAQGVRPSMFVSYGWASTPLGPSTCGNWSISNNNFHGAWAGFMSATGSFPVAAIENPGSLSIVGNLFGKAGGSLASGTTPMGLWSSINYENNRYGTSWEDGYRTHNSYEPNFLFNGTGASHVNMTIRNNEVGPIYCYNFTRPVIYENNIIGFLSTGMNLTGNTELIIRNNIILNGLDSGYGWNIGTSNVYAEGNVNRMGSGNVWYGVLPTSFISNTNQYFGYGITASRPVVRPTGATYFDTTLSKLIMWDGTTWVGALDGYVALSEQSGDPSALANTGKLYTKDEGGDTELYYIDDSGGVVQITRDATVIPSSTASGDLSGSYPGPTVAKIQGYDVATTAPNDGYALVYKSGTAKWTPENHIKLGGYVGAATDAYGMMIPSVNNTLALWSNKVSGANNVSAEVVANINSATIDADHKIAAFYWRDNASTKHEVLNIKDGEINITTAASAAMFSDQADGGSSVAVTLGSTNSFVTAGAKLLSVINGDPAGLERLNVDYRGDIVANKLDNAQNLGIKSLTELTTIAAAADGYSTIQLPANSLIIGVNARVTVVIPTAATFSIGISGNKTKYATGVSVAAGTTSVCLSNSIHYNTSATSILITPDATPGAATGRVRLTINYIDMTAPTS